MNEKNIHVYSLNSAENTEIIKSILKEKIRLINSPTNLLSDTLLIFVAGGSSSGKTSRVTKFVSDFFGENNVLIISQDNYYKGIKYMKEHPELNWDHPLAVDLHLLAKHIRLLEQGQYIHSPIYSFKTGMRAESSEKTYPKKIIIIEGLFVLDDELRDCYSKPNAIKIFVDAGIHGRMIRRLLRDISRTGQTALEILNMFLKIVEPMHRLYVEPTKDKADFIIDNEYRAEIEAKKSGLTDIQLKFNVTNVGINIIEAMTRDAKILKIQVQTDFYYNAPDRNLMETGEMVRIRKEKELDIQGNDKYESGESYLWTYKGPLKEYNDDFSQKDKFEIEIDRKTLNIFLETYPNQLKIIRKTRTIFAWDALIFSLDMFFSKSVSPSFIEVKSDINLPEMQEKLQLLLNKLGLKIEDGINKSYFEII